MRGVLQHQVSLLASSDVQIVDTAGLTARRFQASWRPSARRCKRDAKRLARLHHSYATSQAAVPAGIHPQRSAQIPGLICLHSRVLGTQHTLLLSIVDWYVVLYTIACTYVQVFPASQARLPVEVLFQHQCGAQHQQLTDLVGVVTLHQIPFSVECQQSSAIYMLYTSFRALIQCWVPSSAYAQCHCWPWYVS
jgi:hypothetical protein